MRPFAEPGQVTFRRCRGCSRTTPLSTATRIDAGVCRNEIRIPADARF